MSCAHDRIAAGEQDEKSKSMGRNRYGLRYFPIVCLECGEKLYAPGGTEMESGNCPEEPEYERDGEETTFHKVRR